jgi:hypothetical protein
MSRTSPTWSLACLREMEASSTRMSACSPRPITTSPTRGSTCEVDVPSPTTSSVSRSGSLAGHFTTAARAVCCAMSSSSDR